MSIILKVKYKGLSNIRDSAKVSFCLCPSSFCIRAWDGLLSGFLKQVILLHSIKSQIEEVSCITPLRWSCLQKPSAKELGLERLGEESQLEGGGQLQQLWCCFSARLWSCCSTAWHSLHPQQLLKPSAVLVKVIHYISFSMAVENRPKVKEARNAAGRLNCSGVVVVEFCFQKYFCLSPVAQLVSNLAVFVCVSVSLSNYVCVCVGVSVFV